MGKIISDIGNSNPKALSTKELGIRVHRTEEKNTVFGVMNKSLEVKVETVEVGRGQIM